MASMVVIFYHNPAETGVSHEADRLAITVHAPQSAMPRKFGTSHVG
jgi:hypothetical protein